MHCWTSYDSVTALQANLELQQQVDSLQEEAAQKAASFSSQAEGAAADKAALQQELSELSQALKAAESGQADLRNDQEQWKSKCSKLQQVRHMHNQPLPGDWCLRAVCPSSHCVGSAQLMLLLGAQPC